MRLRPRVLAFWLLPISALPTAFGVLAEPDSPIAEAQRAAIMAGISGVLREPGSATFERIVSARWTGFCGYVDSRNRFGEMTGNRVFYADLAKRSFFVVPSEREVRGLRPDELDRAETMLPVAEANCLGAKRRPIMD